MKIWPLLRGKSETSEPDTPETLLPGLVPPGLPINVATLARCERRRAEISAHENTLALGPELLACQLVAEAHDRLLERLRLSEHAAAAPEQAAAAARDAEGELNGARKVREQREAEHNAASASAKATAGRVARLLADRQVHALGRDAAVAAAEVDLNAAITAGDEAAERAAAGALRLAGDATANPELRDIDARLRALTALLEKHEGTATAAAAALREAEHSEMAAEIAVAAVKSDAALAAYALALLSVVRLRVAAGVAGFEDLASGTGLNQTVYVHAYAQVWFALPFPGGRKGGGVALGDVVLRLAKMMEKPFDTDALKVNLRGAAEAPQAA